MNTPEQQQKLSVSRGIPSGPLCLESPVYIERPPLETLACAELERSGSLTRLKAPRHMGKSSLLLRMLAHAQQQHIAVCTADFLQVDRAILASTDQLLRWLCKTMARQLDVPLDLERYWDSDIGSKVSCTICVEQGLLKSLTTSVMLSVQDLDPVFAHPDVAADLLSLLRSWYEQSRRSPLWKKLRLVLTYTAEASIPLKLEQSPFNVGLPLKLPEFTPDQVHDLAHRYDLQRHLGGDYSEVMDALMDLVGGHPYLTHLAIAHLHSAPEAPFDLLASASDPTGIYGSHLRHYLATVRQQPELVKAIRALTQADDGLKLSAPVTYQLDTLGIIKLKGYRSSLRCRLYQRLFTAEFFEDAAAEAEDAKPFASALSRLEQANQRLEALAYTDGLTRIPNRRAFDVRLRQVWKQLAQNHTPLTLMLCDIDYFKQYNDTHGHAVGDRCLTLVAKILRSNVRGSSDFVFRYGGEEFAVILTQSDAEAAHHRAEAIRSQVSLETRQSPLPGVTISVGAVIVTNAENRDPHQMVQEADHALYESKQLGRDRITFKTMP